MREEFKVRAAVRVGVFVDDAPAPVVEESKQEYVDSVVKARVAVDEDGRKPAASVDEVGPN